MSFLKPHGFSRIPGSDQSTINLDSDNSGKEESRLISDDEFNEGKESRVLSDAFGPTLPWVISTGILLILSITLAIRLYFPQVNPVGTYETGFSTELASGKHIISIEQVGFTGNVQIRDDGTTYLDPGEIQYVGKPSPKIDENWKHLIDHRYFYLTEAEAAETWGKESIEQLYYRLSPDNERRYVAGLDVLHTLHCLNMLRMKLDLDYYPAAAIGSLHNYHCIDQIRQYLMCTGDLTPIPVRWHEALGRPYVDSDKPHTCRNFSALQSWVMNRDEAEF